MWCTTFPYRERWEATKNLVGGGNEDKFKATWNVHSNPLHCHGAERDCRPILTRGMGQLLDNVQNKPSWIKALQESGCSSNEDGLISIHWAFPTTTWSLSLNGGFQASRELCLQILCKKCIVKSSVPQNFGTHLNKSSWGVCAYITVNNNNSIIFSQSILLVKVLKYFWIEQKQHYIWPNVYLDAFNTVLY